MPGSHFLACLPWLLISMQLEGAAVSLPLFTLGLILRPLSCGPIFVPTVLSHRIAIFWYARFLNCMSARCSANCDLQSNARFARDGPTKFQLDHACQPTVYQRAVQESVSRGAGVLDGHKSLGHRANGACQFCCLHFLWSHIPVSHTDER